MAKRLAKILILAIALVMCLGLFAGCGNPTFSEEDHIQRISERVQSRFFADGSEYAELYTDFSIELLYNAKDEPAYFLIEFEPSGFLYGIIDKKDYYFDNGRMGTTNIGTSYWQGGTFFRGSQWGETGEGWWKPSEFVSGVQWINEPASSPSILEEQEGWNYRSHFNVAKTGNEKKYMSIEFFAKSASIAHIATLIKQDGAYVCVVSAQEHQWFSQVSKNKLTKSQKKSLTQL